MNLLVISCAGYPSMENLYKSGFIHSRVSAYKCRGHKCTVFLPNPKMKVMSKYEYLGVEIYSGDISILDVMVKKLQPDVLLIHFITRHVMKYLMRLNREIPAVIWVHGGEVLRFYRRLFDFNLSFKYLRYVLSNIVQMVSFHIFARNVSNCEDKRIKWIFVSEWIRKVACRDTVSHFHDFAIIPNPINPNIFEYKLKEPDDRKKILLIRSFGSRKYANDIAVKSICELSKRDIFNQLRFSIYGDGKLFDRLVYPLHKFKNISIERRFLPQSEISAIHKKHGIILCPTRQDAQGVSMCEAMYSGLVPITSNNTAIPEFVNDGCNGFLTNSYKDIADRIELLYKDTKLFLTLSRNAAESIHKKCRSPILIKNELLVADSFFHRKVDL